MAEEKKKEDAEQYEMLTRQQQNLEFYDSEDEQSLEEYFSRIKENLELDKIEQQQAAVSP